MTLDLSYYDWERAREQSKNNKWDEEKLHMVQGLRMGRAGQRFEWLDSICDGVKKATTHIVSVYSM